MSSVRPKRLSRSFSVALVVLCVIGAGLFAALYELKRQDRLDSETTPLDRMFKANRPKVEASFATETAMIRHEAGVQPVKPPLDRNPPGETEFALFALG